MNICVAVARNAGAPHAPAFLCGCPGDHMGMLNLGSSDDSPIMKISASLCFAVIAALAIPFFMSCSPAYVSKPDLHVRAHDAVLSAGDVVEFKNPNGAGRIIYVSEFVRRYEIGDSSYDVTLVQRDEESLYRTGIYNPGQSWGPLWMRNAPRFVVDESVVHFPSIDEAVNFFRLGYRQKNGLVISLVLFSPMWKRRAGIRSTFRYLSAM